jgi:hypothetical protein
LTIVSPSGKNEYAELREWTLRSLLGAQADVLDELIRRGVLRSRNASVADYSEWLVKGALRLRLEGRSTKGFDALDPRTATRYQIKGKQPSLGNKSRQLSAIRGLNDHGFDKLVALVLDREFMVSEAYLMPHRTVVRHVKFNERQNAHILRLDKKLLADPTVKNITNLMRKYETRVLGKHG